MQSRKLPRLALFTLAVAYGSAVFAGIFAPYSYEEQNRDLPFAPPTPIHFYDNAGQFHLRPFVRQLIANADGSTEYRESWDWNYPVKLFVRSGIDGPFTGPVPDWHLWGVSQPARIFLLGSDSFGRDVFSRLIHGARMSLVAPLGAAAIAVCLGLLLGGVAGFYGGWIDAVLMRIADVFLGMPWLYLLLAARSALPLHMDSRQVYFLLFAVLALVAWPRPARLVRSVVLTVREAEYVLAARGFGASDFHLLLHHILPATRGVALAQLFLYIPQFILAEITLSFFGLGATEPVPSWGNMLADINVSASSSHWWLFAPAVAIFLVLLAYHKLFFCIKERTS